MSKELLMLPGYQLCDYLLVLHPHEELWLKIMNVKKEFAKKFDAPTAEWGKPQITLVRFCQLQMIEERIVNRLKMIAMAMPACRIELKDFGSFPSHTIYIQVDTKMAIQRLVRALKAAQGLLKTREQKPQFTEEGYIPVARQLQPGQYEKSWLEYSHKRFSGRFIASDMLLLRRTPGNKSYLPVQKFAFMNLPVVTTQGQLFV